MRKGLGIMLVGFIAFSLLVAGCNSKPAAAPAAAPATAPPAAPKELPKFRIMVGGMEKIIYLPAKLTEVLGYFKDEGVTVELSNEAAGQNAEEALLAGELEAVVGFYDHNIDLQSKGKKTVDVCIFGGSPGETLVVSNKAKDKIKSIADLKGATIGVTGLGSSTNFLANYLVVRGGNKQSDYKPLAVGAGQTLITAMEQGNIVAAVTTEPTVSLLLKKNDAFVLVDMRDAKNTAAALGGTYPASSLYMMQDYVQKNPEVTQKVVNAFVKTLRWINTHTPEEIAAKLPVDYYGGDKDMYLTALKASLPMFTTDGKMPPEGPATVLNVLSTFNKEMDPKKTDLKATYTDTFVDKVPK
ncbi:MAG TPA: ABC transporter substrate-binding protein [Symbiobacteriaceae bacterium]|jgi:NitT/TauT family transport system substrate-binding protein